MAVTVAVMVYLGGSRWIKEEMSIQRLAAVHAHEQPAEQQHARYAQ
jgi:hypothetical protein